jgi:hypothetical protein
VPLDARKITHIAANREKVRLGRSETVVLVSVSGGSIVYSALGGVVFHESGAVPAGISNRVGEITRTAYDALAEFPLATVFPSGLRVLARTATPTQAGVQAADKYTVLDRRPVGLGVTGSGGGQSSGNRWLLRLRKVR